MDGPSGCDRGLCQRSYRGLVAGDKVFKDMLLLQDKAERPTELVTWRRGGALLRRVHGEGAVDLHCSKNRGGSDEDAKPAENSRRGPTSDRGTNEH